MNIPTKKLKPLMFDCSFHVSISPVISDGLTELKKIYCHRGFWKNKNDQNTKDSFLKAEMRAREAENSF